MDDMVSVLGNDYTLEGATQKMKGHLSWLYWIAGLSLANLAYAFFGQDYFMVAGLGVDSYIASYFATSDEDYYLMQQLLGFGFVLFTLSLSLSLSRSLRLSSTSKCEHDRHSL